jgi:hypothetical protein
MNNDATFTPAEKITVALCQAQSILASAAMALEDPPTLDSGDERAQLRNLIDVAEATVAIVTTYARCWRSLLEGDSGLDPEENVIWH